MKTKKRGKILDTISENDRLKAQVLNMALDRAQAEMTSAKVRMENAQLSIIIAQRDLDTANAQLNEYASDLERKYGFDRHTDSVDWTTGKISRSGSATSSNEE